MSKITQQQKLASLLAEHLATNICDDRYLGIESGWQRCKCKNFWMHYTDYKYSGYAIHIFINDIEYILVGIDNDGTELFHIRGNEPIKLLHINYKEVSSRSDQLLLFERLLKLKSFA